MGSSQSTSIPVSPRLHQAINLPFDNRNIHLKRAKHQFHQRILNTEEIIFPLFTEKSKIIDGRGRRVKLAGVNWSGAHMCRHCVDGLEFRKLRDICREIRSLGFNCVRLTFSLQLFFDNNQIDKKFLRANPQLYGISAIELFDLTVKQLTAAGLMVILNNHTSSSMWCCSTTDGQGLWWTKDYPQNKWIQCLKFLSIRYINNPRVIAFDIRNEIRSTPGFSPTWGDDNAITDWRRASIIGANAVLSTNPNLLVMIGGLNYGLDLKGIIRRPVTGLVIKNKLVYTGHFYGFSWIVPSWSLWTYQDFKKRMWQDQAAVQQLGVPLFLGEFGTNTADIPWKFLMQFLAETDIDFTYWCLDGFKCQPQKDQTYGIYTNDFHNIRHPKLLTDIQALLNN